MGLRAFQVDSGLRVPPVSPRTPLSWCLRSQLTSPASAPWAPCRLPRKLPSCLPLACGPHSFPLPASPQGLPSLPMPGPHVCTLSRSGRAQCGGAPMADLWSSARLRPSSPVAPTATLWGLGWGQPGGWVLSVTAATLHAPHAHTGSFLRAWAGLASLLSWLRAGHPEGSSMWACPGGRSRAPRNGQMAWVPLSPPHTSAS